MYPVLLLNLVLTGCETTAESDQLAPKQFTLVGGSTWNSSDVLKCGPPVQNNEVRVIDMESPGHEQQLSRMGDFVLAQEEPIAVTASGSRVDAELKAVRFAARNGCNLLLLGPVQEEMQRWTGNDASGGIRRVRYLLFRMGRAQG